MPVRLWAPRKRLICAKHLEVRRLDAAFALRVVHRVSRRTQGGVKPPHSKVPSAQSFSRQGTSPGRLAGGMTERQSWLRESINPKKQPGLPVS